MNRTDTDALESLLRAGDPLPPPDVLDREIATATGRTRRAIDAARDRSISPRANAASRR
jgi:hypothetical protein